MVAIVVYSHVYGGWHAASPATCPTPHSQVHGTPCRRYGCPGRRRSPGPSRPYRYPAAASGAVPRNASDGESSGAVPDKWAVPACCMADTAALYSFSVMSRRLVVRPSVYWETMLSFSASRSDVGRRFKRL